MKIKYQSTLHADGHYPPMICRVQCRCCLLYTSFRIMKTHSELGADMIHDMHFPKDNSLVRASWEICRWHHERWDGKGYPDGLKGEEIPISAQVVSIVDVYDALTSERCYKKAFDHDTAIQMILDGQCGQFNPILLKLSLIHICRTDV